MSNNKFEVGESVIILEYEEIKSRNTDLGSDSPGINENMLRSMGKVTTIKKIYREEYDYHLSRYLLEIDHGKWVWREDWLKRKDYLELELFYV